MTQQELEQFLKQNNLSLVEEPMDWESSINYRIRCPACKGTLVLVLGNDASVKAQCLTDLCKVNRYEDDSFACLPGRRRITVVKQRDTVECAGYGQLFGGIDTTRNNRCTERCNISTDCYNIGGHIVCPLCAAREA